MYYTLFVIYKDFNTFIYAKIDIFFLQTLENVLQLSQPEVSCI